jgi:hypothetical protein
MFMFQMKIKNDIDIINLIILVNICGVIFSLWLMGWEYLRHRN